MPAEMCSYYGDFVVPIKGNNSGSSGFMLSSRKCSCGMRKVGSVGGWGTPPHLRLSLEKLVAGENVSQFPIHGAFSGVPVKSQHIPPHGWLSQ